MSGENDDRSSSALTRRLLLQRGTVAASVLALPGVLAACGSSSGGGGESTGGGEASGTVHYMKGPFGEEERKWQKEVNKPFLAEHPDITIDFSEYDFASIAAQMAAAYASGSPPDLAYLGNAFWVAYAKAGALEDITSRVRDSSFRASYKAIPPRFWDSCTLEGKTFGVPLYSTGTAHFVNLDLMKEAGVTDWSSSLTAMQKAAAQVKERTGAWGYGADLPNPNGVGNAFTLVWSAGDELYDSGMTKATVDTPEVTAQLETFQKIYVEDKSAPAPGLYDATALDALFTSGKLGIYHRYCNLATVLTTDAKFNWAIVPMPPAKPGSDPSTYLPIGCGFISSNSGVKEATWEYLDYISSKPAVDLYRTFVPDLYGCRTDLKPVTGSKVFATNEKYYNQVVVPYGRAVPPMPNAATAFEGICTEVESMCSGHQSAADTASGLNEKLEVGLSI